MKKLPSHTALIAVIITIGYMFLFVSNISNTYLWQDEAQTALIAKTVLERGVPYGYDGKNYFSQELGAEYGDHYIWKWHTWLPFYVAAASFKVLGISTFAARIPFVLFGVLTVLLTFFLGKLLFSNQRMGVLSAGVLASCVPFLILSRQCRWYSMAACFSVAGLLCYASLQMRPRLSLCGLVASITFLFHTHYLYAVSLCAALGVHALLFQRERLLKVVIASATAGILNFPWILWLSGMKYGERYGFLTSDFERMLNIGAEYLFLVRQHVFFPFLIAFPLVGILYSRYWRKTPLRSRKNDVQAIGLLLMFVIFTWVLLAVFSPASFFRYLSPIIPAICILGAYCVSTLFEIHLLPGAIGLLMVCLSWPITEYMHEITHDFDGPIEGIVRYLKENGYESDIVAITYGDLSVKFYTRMRVIGGLTGEPLHEAQKADWVIIRRNVICEKDFQVRKYLIDNIDFSQYRRITLNYPDTPFENREEPGLHQFRTVAGVEPVVIFQKNASRPKYPTLNK